MTTQTGDEHSTRDKILIAAASMLGENPTARLSVRSVAARAGVSTGSLRHFFPTQQALVDTVVAGVYDVEIPGDPIRDLDTPPADRLVACLQQVLALVGTGEKARQSWRSVHDAYLATAPSQDAATTYVALERLGRRRFERWLAILADEGALPPGDDEKRARFLMTVVNGLAAERALPADGPRLAFEAATLRMAVHAIVPDAVGRT
ncbi:TetR/AcrR family transcriptional regulator [Cellulomonas xylanilytica]|uniref:HTH tetR-type domain-containing protein n=1 Tax=Cellulomonas xylanilytica TaxID=233583 RepID=A0A510V5H9_9CELL|nr:TetR/AcrR family transcriptional regulator [Cellulomonas xylanilytica]GEK22036.1 hypothetical protein CXY01_25560 [Cellulomonas xylanilytica]